MLYRISGEMRYRADRFTEGNNRICCVKQAPPVSVVCSLVRLDQCVHVTVMS